MLYEFNFAETGERVAGRLRVAEELWNATEPDDQFDAVYLRSDPSAVSLTDGQDFAQSADKAWSILVQRIGNSKPESRRAGREGNTGQF